MRQANAGKKFDNQYILLNFGRILLGETKDAKTKELEKIGRASCRERV